jgi:hypothetical protein
MRNAGTESRSDPTGTDNSPRHAFVAPDSVSVFMIPHSVEKYPCHAENNLLQKLPSRLYGGRKGIILLLEHLRLYKKNIAIVEFASSHVEGAKNFKALRSRQIVHARAENPFIFIAVS